MTHGPIRQGNWPSAGVLRSHDQTAGSESADQPTSPEEVRWICRVPCDIGRVAPKDRAVRP